jgi:hypothetical protein
MMDGRQSPGLNPTLTLFPDNYDLLDVDVAGDSLFLNPENITFDADDTTTDGRPLTGHINFLSQLGLQEILHDGTP